jgi:hypothetical protein
MAVNITIIPAGVNAIKKDGLDFTETICEDIQTLSKKRCPVRTGRLRDSIVVKAEKDGNSVVAEAPYAAKIEESYDFLRTAFDDVFAKLK